VLHDIEDAFDEAGDCFITFQWKLGVHSLFEIAEKTQVKAAKYTGRIRRENPNFHSVISQHL
jgi:hypothetical protein